MNSSWTPGKSSTKKSAPVKLDDVLGDLLGDDDDSFNVESKKSATSKATLARTGAATKDEDFYGALAAGVDDVSDFSVSEADPNVMAKDLGGLDDLEAELFVSNNKSAPPRDQPLSPPPKSALAAKTRPATAPEKKKTVSFSPPASPPKTADSSALASFVGKSDEVKFGVRKKIEDKKIDFGEMNEDDPLAGLLSDEEDSNGTTSKNKTKPIPKKTLDKKTTPEEEKFSVSAFTTDRPPTRSGPATVTAKTESKPGSGTVDLAPKASPPVRKRGEVDFGDDDDPLGTLGISDKPKKETAEAPSRPAKSVMDELLGKKPEETSKPPSNTSLKREFVLDDKYKKMNEPAKPKVAEGDFTFGSYRPSSAQNDSSPSVPRSARGPAILSDSSERPPTARGREPATVAVTSPDSKTETAQSNSDWLGLGDDDSEDVPIFGAKKPAPKPENTAIATPAKVQAKALGIEQKAASRTDDWLASSKESPKKKKLDAGRRRFSVDDWLSQDAEQIQLDAESEGPKKTLEGGKGALEPSANIERPSEEISTQLNPASSRKVKVNELKGGLFDEPDGVTLDSSLNRSLRRSQLSQELFNATDETSQFPSRPSTGASTTARQDADHHLSIDKFMQKPKFLSEPSTPPHRYQQTPIGGSPHYGSSTVHSSDLENKIMKLELENNYLKSTIDMSNRRHQEEIETIVSSHKSRVELLEESFSRREKRLRDDIEQLMAQNLAQIQQLEQDRTVMIAGHHRRLEERERDKAAELDRLRDIHRSTIADLQHEHEDTITRLRQAKERELESVTDVQSHTRSIQNVITKLEDHSKNLGALQYKVDDQSNTNIQQRDEALRVKDEQLKGLEQRLSRQQADNDRERLNLQQLIGKMEAQMREQTRQLDEERWGIKQERVKLEALHAAADGERALAAEELARDKVQVQKSKDELLQEQKRLMTQMYEERRALAAERAQFELDQRMKSEKMQTENIRISQSSAELEGKMRALNEERDKLTTNYREIQAERQRLATLQSAVDTEKTQVLEEKKRLDTLAENLRERSTEVERRAESITQMSEEGRMSLAAARKLEESQTQRLNTTQNQLEALRKRETEMAGERLSLAKFKAEVESARQATLCVNCRQPSDGRVVSRYYFGDAVQPSRMSSPLRQGQLNRDGYVTSSIENDHALRKWRIQADKDKDFLEDEVVYLHALQRTPYHKQTP